MANLKKNIFYLVVIQGLNFLVPLLIFPYLARTLGTVNFGKLSFATTVILYCNILIDYGFTLSATKQIAEVQQDNIKINNIFWDVFFSKLLLFILTIVLIVIAIFLFAKLEEMSLILLALIPQLLASAIFPLWYFQGIEKINVIVLSQVIAKFSILPLTFLIVTSSGDVVKAAIIQSMGLLLAAILSWIYIYRKSVIRLPINLNLINIANQIKDSTSFFVGGFAISLYTISTPLLLGFLSTSHEVGIYSAADKLRGAIAAIFIIAGGAIFPRITALFTSDPNKAFYLLKQIMIIQFLLLTIVSISYLLLGENIINIVLGTSYHAAAKLNPLLIIAMFCSVISVILCNYILVPLGHKKIYYRVPIFIGIVHLIYSWVLVKHFAALGASISIAISEVLTLLILFGCCLRLGYIKKIIFASPSNN